MSSNIRGYIYQDSNPWVVRIPLLFITGLFLFAFVMIIALAGFQYTYQEKIYPGVSTVYGVDLTGMTREEAKVALEQAINYDTEAIFIFRNGDQTWEYTAADLGVRFDIDATVEEAYRVGRSQGMVGNIWDQWTSWRSGVPVVPIVTYDQSQAEQILAQIASDYIDRPVVDATISIKDGKAQTTTSQVGRIVDVPETLNLLRHQIVNLSTRSELNIVVKEQAPTVWETETVAQQINTALDPSGVTFYIPTEMNIPLGPWTATPQSIENMLRIEKVDNGDGTAHYEVSLTNDQVGEFLNRISPDLHVEPVNARFTFNDDTKQLEVLQPSQNGRGLDIAATLPGFNQAVFSADNRQVPLSFQSLSPAVADTMTAAELGIIEETVSATTYYAGSTVARRTNVEVAASRFHGVVIEPYSEFSFNQYLGEVSAESGFEQGLIIFNGQTITGVGGGVCQVSSTVFQAAFYGGFPILERYPHGYRVGYYEAGEGPGMDATVFEPVVNFRFHNDTPYHILIETYVAPASSSLTIKFYSTDTGRKVIKDGPYIKNIQNPPPPVYHATPGLRSGQVIQVDYSVAGADVYVYRTIKAADGTILVDSEEFVSNYIPWPSQFQVAVGDPRAN